MEACQWSACREDTVGKAGIKPHHFLLSASRFTILSSLICMMLQKTSFVCYPQGVTIVKPIVFGNVARYFGKKREEDGHTHQWSVYVKPYRNEVNSTVILENGWCWLQGLIGDNYHWIIQYWPDQLYSRICLHMWRKYSSSYMKVTWIHSEVKFVMYPRINSDVISHECRAHGVLFLIRRSRDEASVRDHRDGLGRVWDHHQDIFHRPQWEAGERCSTMSFRDLVQIKLDYYSTFF